MPKWLFVVYSLATRAMTLGVRGVVQDDRGRVLLVRHTYGKGWHFPGGGVERGETLAEAIAKELREEASVILKKSPRHFHTYRNTRTSRFDHVALFICDGWEHGEPWQPNSEIAEIGFFPLEDLPKYITPYTRVRLEEIFNNQPISDYW